MTLNQPISSTPLIRLIGPFLIPERQKIIGALAAMTVSSVMMLAIGWGLKCVIDRGFAAQSGAMLNQALLVMLVIILAMSAASFFRLMLMNGIAERLAAALRLKLFAHLLALDPGYYDRHKTGDMVARINADTTVLQLVLSSQFPVLLRHSLMLAGGVMMLCVTSPLMTGIMLLAVPVVIGPLVFFARRVRLKSRETQESVGAMTSYTLERLQGVQTIQAFGHESASHAGFTTHVNATVDRALGHVRARAWMTAIVIFVVFTAIGVVLWAGGHKVLAGEMTGGDLSAFIFYAATVAGSVMNLSDAGGEYSRASGAADRLQQVLDSRPVLKGTGGADVLETPVVGDIAFRNIVFSYPMRPQRLALDDVSFTIPAQSMTAIVGPSGAGKTTVFQLLQRFYDAESGVITIDGQDINLCDPHEIRRHLGVVSQDPAVFSISVADNIRLAKPEATTAEIQRAAEMAQAHEFISNLPQGYATVVGERGSQLSGGQRQRIAIARAFLKDPKILLLDEATSALDAANEKAVHFALKTLMRNRTTVIIAHRLSTVRHADHILVLDQGRVVAEGTHDSLKGMEGVYSRLAGLQQDDALSA